LETIKKNKGIIILLIGIIGIVIVNWDKIMPSKQSSPTEYSESMLFRTTEELNNLDTILVDVKGEVNSPGLYEVGFDLRVGDIIGVAGGITNEADLSEINLAEKLTDEMIIYVPKKSEISTVFIPNDIVKIIVEIKGEVAKPGIYYLNKNSRLNDLILIAGSETLEADMTSVELARVLSDGESITIPKKVETKSEVVVEESPREIYVEIIGEVINPGVYLILEDYTISDLIYEAGGVTVNCDLSKIDWNLTLCLGATIYIPSYEDVIDETEISNLININTANLESLMTLPGVGNIIGQRIIDYRSEYGDFLSIEQIVRVSGIKDSIYENIKELITV